MSFPSKVPKDLLSEFVSESSFSTTVFSPEVTALFLDSRQKILCSSKLFKLSNVFMPHCPQRYLNLPP